jgi:hypothetical protein
MFDANAQGLVDKLDSSPAEIYRWRGSLQRRAGGPVPGCSTEA